VAHTLVLFYQLVTLNVAINYWCAQPLVDAQSLIAPQVECTDHALALQPVRRDQGRRLQEV
jgi:hypothetical protein